MYGLHLVSHCCFVRSSPEATRRRVHRSCVLPCRVAVAKPRLASPPTILMKPKPSSWRVPECLTPATRTTSRAAARTTRQAPPSRVHTQRAACRRATAWGASAHRRYSSRALENAERMRSLSTLHCTRTSHDSIARSRGIHAKRARQRSSAIGASARATAACGLQSTQSMR